MNGLHLSVAPPPEAPPRRLLSRTRLNKLVRFTSSQMLVQVLGFLAGLVLVRNMVQTDYGHYTLAVSLVGLANVLFDLGLATAVLAVGGALHAKPQQLGALLGDAYSLQRRLALGGAVLLLPGCAAMLAAQALVPAEVAALSLLVIACTGLNVRNQIVLSVVRLRGDVAVQQRAEIAVNLGKLFVMMGAALVYINAVVAMAVNLAAAAALFWLLHRYLRAQIGTVGPAMGTHHSALRGFVRRQAPNSLYYCISGQVALWLVAALGNADRVAEVGALGRLALFFTVIGAVVTALVQPYFARARGQQELVAGYVALNIFFALLTLGLVGLALATPGSLLWVLGPKYAALTHELAWMVLATSLGAWSGAVYAVGAARGWVVPSWLVIPVGIVTTGLAAWSLDLSTVAGSFQMNTVVALVTAAVTVGFVGLKLVRQQRTGEPGALT